MATSPFHAQNQDPNLSFTINIDTGSTDPRSQGRCRPANLINYLRLGPGNFDIGATFEEVKDNALHRPDLLEVKNSLHVVCQIASVLPSKASMPSVPLKLSRPRDP